MKFDLHVHTNISSDSSMTVDELFEAAQKKGLSGVATSNHNAFLKAQQREGFYFIPACEFSTDIGHLLVYFQKLPVNRSLARDELGRFFWRDICKFAHDQDALVFLAHPFSPEKQRPSDLYDQIDGIEVHNSRVVHSRIKGANAKALKLANRLSKPVSAGSDAHCPDEVGTSYWECDLPESAMSEPDFEERLKKALLSRNCRVFAGNAPERVVVRCKMRSYKKMKLYTHYTKNLMRLIKLCIFKPSSKPACGKYLNLKG